MNWLLRRVLALCGILAVTIAAVLVVARLNRTPNTFTLQALGFDVCDGTPCYKGIKPGMSWAMVRKRFPNAIVDGSFLAFPVNTKEAKQVTVTLSVEGLFVANIAAESYSDLFRTPIQVNEIIINYGPPCRLGLHTNNSPPYAVSLMYPNFTVTVDDPQNPIFIRLRTDLPTYGLGSAPDPTICDRPFSNVVGPWRGFTSAEIYLSRNRRDSAIPQP